MSGSHSIVPEKERAGKKAAFLECYRRFGSVRKACEAAGVPRRTHYDWLEADPEYAEAVKLAAEDVADSLEEEVLRRAREGVEEPAGWYKGQPGGYVRKFSDVLAIFTLKGLRPEKYRERVELKGSLANLDLTRLSDEQLGRIAAGEHPLAVLASAAGEIPSASPTASAGQLPPGAPIEEAEEATADDLEDADDAG